MKRALLALVFLAGLLPGVALGQTSISNMPNAGPLTGAELVPLVQGGANVKTNINQFNATAFGKANIWTALQTYNGGVTVGGTLTLGSVALTTSGTGSSLNFGLSGNTDISLPTSGLLLNQAALQSAFPSCSTGMLYGGSGSAGNGQCVTVGSGLTLSGGTLSGATGGGTVNAGTANQLAFYSSSGTAVSGLTTGNSGLLVTSAGGVPSISTNMPNGIGLGTPASGVATNLSGTAAGLTAGHVTTNANLTGPITSTGNATAIGAQTGTGSTFVMSVAPTISGLTVTGSLSATGLVTNGDLVNDSVTVNGENCTLGSACTITTSASTITVGSTAISGGTSGYIEFNNGGVLGEKATTGSGSVVLGSAATISGIALGSNLDTLTFGTHLTAGGSSYNGSAGVTITSDATSANTASTIMARDSSGNFAGGTFTGSVTGHASLDLALTGGTLTGGLTTVASATGGAGLNIPPGTAPTSPNNGDCWTTSSGLYCQINGSTVGPYGAGGGSITITAGTGITLSSGSTCTSACTASTTVPMIYPDSGADTTSIAIGTNALATQSAQPKENVGVGLGAAACVSTGGANTAVGYETLTGVKFGSGCPSPLTGGGNVAVGYGALAEAVGVASGNTAVGRDAGLVLSSGSSNTLMGNFVASSTLATGTGNILVGTASNCDTASSSTADFFAVCASSGSTQLLTGTLTSGSLALVDNGTLTLNSVSTATGNYLCISAGLVSQESTACPASDAAVKHDVETITDPGLLDKVTGENGHPERGVRFTYNEGAGAPGRQIGVIANEWEGDFPELVSRDPSGIRHFNYDFSFGVTVAALKAERDEYKERFVRDEARIASLEGRVAAIEAGRLRATTPHGILGRIAYYLGLE